MLKLRFYSFWVVMTMIGLVLATKVIISPLDQAAFGAQTTHTEVTVEAGSTLITSQHSEEEDAPPSVEALTALTTKPQPLKLTDNHLVLSGEVYDAACFEQTWPQNCRIGTLPAFYTVFEGTVYDANCLEYTWYENCIVNSRLIFPNG